MVLNVVAKTTNWSNYPLFCLKKVEKSSILLKEGPQFCIRKSTLQLNFPAVSLSTRFNFYMYIVVLFNFYYSDGSAAVIDGNATIIIPSLNCSEAYQVIAGGTVDGMLEGPRSLTGIFTDDCMIPVAPTTPASTLPSVIGTILGLCSYAFSEFHALCMFHTVQLINGEILT